MAEADPRRSSDLLQQLASLEARLILAQRRLLETRAQIEREGPSPTLNDQLRDDEQAWALLRRQLDRLRKRLES